MLCAVLIPVRTHETTASAQVKASAPSNIEGSLLPHAVQFEHLRHNNTTVPHCAQAPSPRHKDLAQHCPRITESVPATIAEMYTGFTV